MSVLDIFETYLTFLLVVITLTAAAFVWLVGSEYNKRYAPVDRLLYRLTASLPTRLIKLDGAPYLERYYLGQPFGVTFYLHRFVSADKERHLHNHPWVWGRALVLSGGYDEEVVTDLCGRGALTETRRINWWNRVDGAHFHRIANAAPRTWTLFFHGPRARIQLGQTSVAKGWGFIDGRTFTPWPVASGDWWDDAPEGQYSGREGRL